MTQTSPDPSDRWSAQLSRLDGVRRAAVDAALRRSTSDGWPASREAVELLVGYALGEITASDYAAGIVRSWSVPDDEPVQQQPVQPEPAPERDVHQAPQQPRVRIGREEAVHAYVTGVIDVGEFLRLARS